MQPLHGGRAERALDLAGARRWPIHDDNPPIEGGLPIERGATLRVYEWRDYLAGNVLEAFERRYWAHDVRVRVESFLHMEEAIARLRRPDAEFDTFFPTIDAIGGLVDARVLRPLNHDYLPNVRNLWREFRGSANPFYDEGQRYTVPYTTYSSGIGWRRDLVAARDAPDASDDPFGVLWNPRYRATAGVYDSYREAMALGLLHRGEPIYRAPMPPPFAARRTTSSALYGTAACSRSRARTRVCPTASSPPIRHGRGTSSPPPATDAGPAPRPRARSASDTRPTASSDVTSPRCAPGGGTPSSPMRS